MHTVFTNSSPNGKGPYVIGSHGYSLAFPPTSAQIIELCAVATVFAMLKENKLSISILIANVYSSWFTTA